MSNGIDVLTYAAAKAYTDKHSGGGGGGSVNVVQTTGTSTTDVMSQNAVTSMVFGIPSNGTRVKIGNNITTVNIGNSPYVAIGEDARVASCSVAVGSGANASGLYSVAIGSEGLNGPTRAATTRSVAIGDRAETLSASSGGVAIGAFSNARLKGEFNIGLPAASTSQLATYGYNGSEYRLLTGLYDPQSDHDAATKGYVDNSTTAFVNLSVVSMTSTTITVTPDKTIAEVNDLVNDGRHVVIKLVTEQDVGSFLAGTYFFNLAFVASSGLIANAVQYATGTSFEYQQLSSETNGIITIRSLT